MGSVTAYETAAGKRYRVRYRKPDRTQTDKRGFKSKRDAELFLSSVEVAKARGEYVDPTAGRTTVEALGDVWLDSQTHLKPSALDPIQRAYRLYVVPRWGSTSIGDVQHTDVQTWVSQLTQGKAKTAHDAGARSASVVLRAYGILASILDGAVKDRRLPSNPARGVTLPRKAKKSHAYLSHSQVELLAQSTTTGNTGTLVRFLSYTGLRWGEATALRLRDVDTLRRRVSVTENAVMVSGTIVVGTPKSHKTRTVPYPAFLELEVARACQDKQPEDLLFGDGGRYLRPPDARDGWFVSALNRARAIDKSLPRVTPHDLRHTAASLAVSAGANVKAIQRMLGHASAAMTLDVYADLFDDDLDAVANALDAARLRTDVGKVWAEVPIETASVTPIRANTGK